MSSHLLWEITADWRIQSTQQGRMSFITSVTFTSKIIPVLRNQRVQFFAHKTRQIYLNICQFN